MKPACQRTWEGEAIEDGRLSSQARSSFERHAETCTLCSRELESLARLRAAASRLGSPESAPLERRRLRQRLLRRANDMSLRASPPSWWRSRPLELVVLPAIAICAILVGWFRSREIAVPVTISPATTASAQVELPIVPVPTSVGGRGAVDPVPDRAPPPSGKPRARPKVMTERVDAGADFANAMSAFSKGDYERAEELFLLFERRHPSDGRAEDASFLRAVARARRGDAAGARQLAREYLNRHPDGLRRLEAERLAQ